MLNGIIERDLKEIYETDIDWNVLENKTVLITGAYGMLASYVTLFLQYLKLYKNINVKVIAIVRSKRRFYRKFQDLINVEEITVYENELCDFLNIREDIDYIIHAASLASPQHYSVRPVDVLLPNTIGCFHLLNLAKEKNVDGFLLFSSCDVYGSVDEKIRYISEVDYGIMDTLDIHNCYSESKRMAETMCESFFIQYNVPVKIARIAHTYAPTMDIENDPRVFSSFVKNIVDKENIVMKSDGLTKRSFCYITDAVVAYFKILLDGRNGEAYNVCNTSQFVSVKELANLLSNLYPERNINVMQKERSINENYIENPFALGRIHVPDYRKLRELGWEPTVTIEDGFDRVIKYIESK